MEKIFIDQPLVSVIIPVYNGSNYLAEAINSVIDQTYKNIEIIVVNDGSNDHNKTRDIALSYGNKIIYYEKPNGGVSSALNLGISKMSGKYFSWLSHDDIYFNSKIFDQLEFVLKNEINFVFSKFKLIDKNSKQLISKKKFSLNRNLFIELLVDQRIHGCATLISKSLIDEVGNFDEKLRYTQDYDFWFKILVKEKIFYLDKFVLFSRVHVEQGASVKNHNAYIRTETKNLLSKITKHTLITQNFSINELLYVVFGLSRKGFYEISDLFITHCDNILIKNILIIIRYSFSVINKIYKWIKKV